MKQQPEFEVEGFAFIRSQENEYGARWTVFLASDLQEDTPDANPYGCVEDDGIGYVLTTNTASDHPLCKYVSHAGATFIEQQDERDVANHGLAILGL